MADAPISESKRVSVTAEVDDIVADALRPMAERVRVEGGVSSATALAAMIEGVAELANRLFPELLPEDAPIREIAAALAADGTFTEAAMVASDEVTAMLARDPSVPDDETPSCDDFVRAARISSVVETCFAQTRTSATGARATAPTAAVNLRLLLGRVIAFDEEPWNSIVHVLEQALDGEVGYVPGPIMFFFVIVCALVVDVLTSATEHGGVYAGVSNLRATRKAKYAGLLVAWVVHSYICLRVATNKLAGLPQFDGFSEAIYILVNQDFRPLQDEAWLAAHPKSSDILTAVRDLGQPMDLFGNYSAAMVRRQLRKNFKAERNYLGVSERSLSVVGTETAAYFMYASEEDVDNFIVAVQRETLLGFNKYRVFSMMQAGLVIFSAFWFALWSSKGDGLRRAFDLKNSTNRVLVGILAEFQRLVERYLETKEPQEGVQGYNDRVADLVQKTVNKAATVMRRGKNLTPFDARRILGWTEKAVELQRANVRGVLAGRSDRDVADVRANKVELDALARNNYRIRSQGLVNVGNPVPDNVNASVVDACFAALGRVAL